MDSFPPLPKGISGRCGIISHSGIMRALIYMEFAYSQQSFHPEVFPTWLCFSIVENPRECWIPKIPKPRKTGPSPKAKLCDPRFGNAMSKVHKFHPAPGAALGMITGNRSRELQKILLAYAANKPKPIPTFQFHLFFFLLDWLHGMKGTVRIYGVVTKNFWQGGTSHQIPGTGIPLFGQLTNFAQLFPFPASLPGLLNSEEIRPPGMRTSLLCH